MQVCKAAEYAHAQKMKMGDSSMKDTTPDMCTTMLHYALSLALTGNYDQSECAFEKLTRTTEKTWGINSFQLATVFVEQSKARLAEGRHHDTQVIVNATNGGSSSVCALLMRDLCSRAVHLTNTPQILLAKTLAIGAHLSALPCVTPRHRRKSDIFCRYDSNAGILLQVRALMIITKHNAVLGFKIFRPLQTPHKVFSQMHACMEMANMFEAQDNIADASLHRASAIRHLQTSVLGADSMFVANAHAKNGNMMHKVGVAARLHLHR